jgi:transposase
VDYYENHHQESCPVCYFSSLEIVEKRIKQVLEIPLPKMEITAHGVYRYQCRLCGYEFKSDQYDLLKQEVHYATCIKALVSYLNVHQLVPYKRLTYPIN